MSEEKIESEVEEEIASKIASRIDKALLRRVQSAEYQLVVEKSEKSALYQRLSQLESRWRSGQKSADPPLFVELDELQDFYNQMQSDQEMRCALCDKPLAELGNFDQHLLGYHFVRERKVR